MKEWIFLFLAIGFEIMGTTSMKLSHGFSNIFASVMIFIFYTISFIFFTLALKRLELGVSYAIWSAVGTAIIALIGIFYFGESINFLKIASLLFIIIGVVGLHLSGI